MLRSLVVASTAVLLSLAAFADQPRSSSAGSSSADNVALTPEQLHRVPPPSPETSAPQLEERGDELRAEKAFLDAIDYYRAAIKKAPSAQLYNKMGMSQLLMMRPDQAKHAFEKAIKLDPAMAYARNNLGVVYYHKKNYGKAIHNYEDALKLDDESASFHSNLATAYFARKQYEKASQQYLRALELDPDIFTRRSEHGISAHMTTQTDRAKYSYVIAKMYATKGDAERCLLYLRKAIEDGYPVAKEIYKEAEFTTIRKDPRFNELMAEKIVAIPN